MLLLGLKKYELGICIIEWLEFSGDLESCWTKTKCVRAATVTSGELVGNFLNNKISNYEINKRKLVM